MYDVQLLNLTSENNTTGLDDRWQLPLNHLWLGTYLQTKGYSVQVLDTNIIPLNELINRINAPVLAISFLAPSAHLLKTVTGFAKKKDCFVVVGGQAATPLAKQLLQKNKNIDVVVRGDGEEALLGITKIVLEKKGSLESIPNLAYLSSDKVKYTQTKRVDVTKLPIPDRRLPGIDIEQYISNFESTNTDSWTESLRATNAYVKKGCPRRVKNRGCSFCARIDVGIRSKSALQAYKEYNYLINEFGVNYIYDDSDSWVDNSWLKELVKIYETNGNLQTRFRVYADLKDITKENVTLLKTVGVDAVLIGIESGDKWVSRINGKPVTPKRTIQAARLIGNAGIKMWDAYVLGMIGETKESVSNTRKLSLELYNYCQKPNTYWSLIQPFPGSPIWNEMMKIEELYSNYGNEYIINLNMVQKEFIDRFCNLGTNGYRYLKDVCKEFQLSEGIPWRDYIR